MAAVALSSQLQQWSFDKSRPERADSSASSPRLDQQEAETLKIEHVAAVEDVPSAESKEIAVLQECYLSSEEDLSTVEGDSSDSEADEVISIHDGAKEGLQARKMSVARFENGKSCDMAIKVSYLSAGRPKVIELAALPTPTRDTSQPARSASLTGLPTATVNRLKQLDQSSRLSLAPSSFTNRPTSPARIVEEPRRPSTGYAHTHFSHHNSALHISDSSSFDDTSARSSTSASSNRSTRPASVAARRPPMPSRSSLYPSSATVPTQTRPFPPLTPLSPNPPSFLSSDPYENSTTSAASPIIKNSPHKRLRSISQRLSLAKIAIKPTKKWDSRIDGKSNTQMPPTPATPYTPLTPMTAPPFPSTASTLSFNMAERPPTASTTNRLRRNSRFSRPGSIRGPSPDIPAVPKTPVLPRTSSMPMPRPPSQSSQFVASRPKLVARGANEREPMLELPPFPDDVMDAATLSSVSKAKKIRKRKSLMELLG